MNNLVIKSDDVPFKKKIKYGEKNEKS